MRKNKGKNQELLYDKFEKYRPKSFCIFRIILNFRENGCGKFSHFQNFEFIFCFGANTRKSIFQTISKLYLYENTYQQKYFRVIFLRITKLQKKINISIRNFQPFWQKLGN